LLLLLVGFYQISERLFSRKGHGSGKALLETQVDSIQNFTIQLVGEETEMTFTKMPKKWLVEQNNIFVNLPNDSILQFINKLAYLEIVRPDAPKLSEQTAKNFELNAIKIGYTAQGKTKNFKIGKSKLDSVSNTFITEVELVGDELHYLVRGNLRSIFDHKFTRFRNATILHFDKNDAISIQIGKGNTLVSGFVKKDSVWVSNKKGEQVNQDSFKNFVSTIATLNGTIFCDGCSAELSAKKPDQWIIIRLKSRTDSLVLKGYTTKLIKQKRSSLNDDEPTGPVKRETTIINTWVLNGSNQPKAYFRIDSIHETFWK
jgi:hypothetical protein